MDKPIWGSPDGRRSHPPTTFFWKSCFQIYLALANRQSSGLLSKWSHSDSALRLHDFQKPKKPSYTEKVLKQHIILKNTVTVTQLKPNCQHHIHNLKGAHTPISKLSFFNATLLRYLNVFIPSAVHTAMTHGFIVYSKHYNTRSERETAAKITWVQWTCEIRVSYNCMSYI